MIVQVAADGAYALVQPGDDRPRPMSEEELETRIRAILHQNPNQAIFVGGDAATSYQTLMDAIRSEEHTSELQSLMRISYAVFCLKKKKNHKIRKYQQFEEENIE